ncbi:ATP-binding protein [Streptomyces sp. TE33382]
MLTDQHHGPPATTNFVARATFASRADSVAAARAWALSVYVKDGGQSPDACELLVSEVATNAVAHAGGTTFTVRVLPGGWVEVEDSSPALPIRRRAEANDTGGRGLEILELLAPGYKVAAGREGKVVRFRPQGEGW